MQSIQSVNRSLSPRRRQWRHVLAFWGEGANPLPQKRAADEAIDELLTAYRLSVSRQHCHCLGLGLGFGLGLDNHGFGLSLGLNLTVCILLSRDQDSSRHLTSEETHRPINQLVDII